MIENSVIMHLKQGRRFSQGDEPQMLPGKSGCANLALVNVVFTDIRKAEYCQVKPPSTPIGGWNQFIAATVFRLKSSATPFG
jgi:hypothetical protein